MADRVAVRCFVEGVGPVLKSRNARSVCGDFEIMRMASFVDPFGMIVSNVLLTCISGINRESVPLLV